MHPKKVKDMSAQCAINVNLYCLYQSWIDTGMNSASLSSVATTVEVQNWENSFACDSDKLKDIQRYCEARIDDVEGVNDASHTLAAFTTISILIGFLADLSFGKNRAFRQRFGNGKIDTSAYRVFVRRFILGRSDADAMADVLPANDGGNDCKGLDWVLYKYVRCGLVHSSSLMNERIDSAREITVKVTHSNKMKQDAPALIDALIAQRTSGQPIAITLVAQEFCNWVRSAINLMFAQAQTDSNLATSIIEVFKEETPVIKFEPI